MLPLLRNLLLVSQLYVWFMKLFNTLFLVLFLMKIVPAQEVDSDGFDGRFALGLDGKQILFGYPSSQPTSFFMVRLEKPTGGYMYATNKQQTKQKATLLKSTAVSLFRDGVKIQQNRFQFSVFDIVQEIIPLNNMQQPALFGELVKQFQVLYRIENRTKQTYKMGFAQFLDFKIDDNDACRAELGNERISKSSVILPSSEDSRIRLFNTDYDRDGFVGELQFRSDKINVKAPERIYLGDFRDLEGAIWNWQLKKKDYLDAALVLEWADVSMQGGSNYVHSFLIGIPEFVAGSFDLLEYTGSEEKDFIHHTLYFELGSSSLSEIQVKNLDELLADKSIRKIHISGFSDQLGTNEQCDRVSKNRAESVRQFLTKNIAADFDTELYYFGKSRAGILTEEQLKSGNEKDRRVDLLVELW